MNMRSELVEKISELELVGALITNDLDEKFYDAKSKGYDSLKKEVIGMLSDGSDTDLKRQLISCTIKLDDMKAAMKAADQKSIEDKGEAEGQLVGITDIGNVINEYNNKIAAANIKK